MLGGGDLVGSQVHQLGAAGRFQGTPGGSGEVMMLAPPRGQHADHVDVQEPGRRRGDLADCGLAGGLRDVLQSTVKVHPGGRRQQRLGQRLRSLLLWAEKQIQCSGLAALQGWRHGPASSIVVMLVPGLGSMRTVCVTPVPVSWTLTEAGGPVSVATCTVGAAACGCERSRRRRTAIKRPAATGTAAASKMSRAPVPFEATASTLNECVTAGAGA